MKVIFFALDLDIGQKWVHFLRCLEITYQSILLSARSDNIKPVKKIKKNTQKLNKFFFLALGLDLSLK